MPSQGEIVLIPVPFISGRNKTARGIPLRAGPIPNQSHPSNKLGSQPTRSADARSFSRARF
jgi:hypothetical protein